MPDPDWLPNLIEFDGNWQQYIDHLYTLYLNDFRHENTHYAGDHVAVQRRPESNGKGKGFWHCVSEGPIEEDRIPDLSRCSRILWIRAIIENGDDNSVDIWENTRGNETRVLLWFNEEYLVVLAKRNGFYLLKSAYTTNRKHGIEKKRRERDDYHASKNG